MRKLAVGIVSLSLIFLTAPGLFAQPPVSIEGSMLYGGGALTDGVDSLYFGLRVGEITVYRLGVPLVEKSGGLLVLVSDEGPVLSCRVQDAQITCGGDSVLTCKDGPVVKVNDSEDTLSFDGTTYYLEYGIIQCGRPDFE